MDSDSDDSRTAWSRYWSSGHTENMFGSSRTNLERFWFGHVMALPRGARLLDLATGSGHVARLAVRCGDGMRLGLEIDGVDYADIAGERIAPATRDHCGLTLTGQVRIEALPFADASFDGVVSQFGIEYAQLAPTAREIARVLKPGGGGLFVLHHKDSAITAMTTARLAARREVLGDAPFAPARGLFDALLRGESADAWEAALREQVAGMRARLGTGFQYENVAQTVSFLVLLADAPAQYEPRDARAKIDAAIADSTAWEGRQRAQIAAALDDAGIARWVAEFARLGMRAEPPLVIANERRHAVGWRLAIKKGA